MQHPIYPPGAVTALLESGLVTPQTKQILKERLAVTQVTQPEFFSVEEFEIVKAVCQRLIPQQRTQPVDIAGGLDTDLAANKGNGWRYNSLPPDQQTFKTGINAINKTAEEIHQLCFNDLQETDQDKILEAIQNGSAVGEAWKEFSGKLFFEELLSRVVEIYYSHPLAKEEIGDVSFADAEGWQNIGLNKTDPQEPLPIGESHV